VRTKPPSAPGRPLNAPALGSGALAWQAAASAQPWLGPADGPARGCGCAAARMPPAQPWARPDGGGGAAAWRAAYTHCASASGAARNLAAAVAALV